MHANVTAELIHRIPVANVLGEGIQWNIERGEVWWTDIVDCKLYSYHWQSRALSVRQMPESVCAFAFIENDSRLLIAFSSGFALYQPKNDQVEWLHPDICDGVNHRLNDGRVDRQGRFWCGSLVLSDEQSLKNSGKLYRLNGDLSLSIQEENIQISNGLCWSQNSKTMYFSDSPKQTIYQYAFNQATGSNSARTELLTTPTGAYPDGANVDSQDCIWSALWGAGRIARYNSEGHEIASIPVPASQPTCIAFGGDDLSTLFVSSATQDLSDSALQNEPRAGSVFVFKTNVKGLSESQFILD